LSGLRLSKCLPHSRNLVAKAAPKFFENAHNAVQRPPCRRILNSLEVAGLSACKMMVYLNRHRCHPHGRRLHRGELRRRVCKWIKMPGNPVVMIRFNSSRRS
jgi:hypothetical protein